MRKTLTVLVLFLLVAGASGCRRGGGAGLVSPAPPSHWEAMIEEGRERKDRYFRTSPESPLLPEDVAAFERLDYWPVDPGFYFVGSIEYHAEPQMLEMTTTTGATRPCANIGRIRFVKDDRSLTLDVYRLLDQQETPGVENFFLPFQDQTTGEESYPAGRYIDLIGPLGGPYEVDFNRAYNPSCAYGDPGRFACPVTPSANRLDIRIEAGERGFKHAS